MMIGQNQRARALHVVWLAKRNFGSSGFRVDLAGKHYRPLKDAESLGWVRFLADDRAGLTEDGLAIANNHDIGVSA